VTKKYRVVFMGLLEEVERFKQGMFEIGIRPSMADRILEKAPVVLKAGMTLADARLYAEAIQSAGGRVNIQEQGLFEEPSRPRKVWGIKPFEYFTMCPECGHKQPKKDRCMKCGFVFGSNGGINREGQDDGRCEP